ncbi:MAG TPA: hypothetical protein VF549_00240 [Solirubrobacteraceae bacterium]|jgi:hypothetical protein
MTLIGNTNSLAVELIPVAPSWERRYEPEAAAWAGAAVWVGGRNLCAHVLAGTREVQEQLFVPLGPVVDWLVDAAPGLVFEERAKNFPTRRRLHDMVERWAEARPPLGYSEDDWLDLREDWWKRHFLRAGVDGARLPDLAFLRDDEDLVVSWRRPRFFGAGVPVMLWPEGEFALPWREGIDVLAAFASQVAEWMRAAGITNPPWIVDSDPLGAAIAGVDARQALELFTGRALSELSSLFQVSDLPELLHRLELPDAAGDPAASAQCQVLRDLSPHADPAIGDLLSELSQRATYQADDRRRRWLERRDVAIDAAKAGETLERSGQLAANEVRAAMSMDGEPIGDMPAVLGACGVDYSHSNVAGGHDRMMVGVPPAGGPTAFTLETQRTETDWGRRFEQARALGHMLLDPMREHAVGAASGPFAQASRRRRSGAFAAELLLPESALVAASSGTLDGAARGNAFSEMLETYGVGARTAAFQLWNKGWLSDAVVRDELIDRFATADRA